ncbi:hypothetical protein Bca52824_006326 [Brassica carinata]|uniref:RING-type E3 ubiquitin transferase n=1 Tax=Brassica carinata TaxID=52824 RepID=A0A8X7WRW4_BRACI|nr:hypothetical protein Bca52824_006326 [Brassica carinata]
MGTGNSKESWRQESSSSFRSASASSASPSSSSSWASHQSYPQYGPESYNYPPSHSYAPPPPPPPEYSQPPPAPSYSNHNQPYSQPPPSRSYGSDKKRLERKYSKIADEYSSLEQVTEALARAGLESSNLIVGIDFTKSNEWTGARSFNRKSLHFIGNNPNPYEQAITIIGRTLAFDEDNLIPCYGFGDASTHDQDVFSFNPEDRFCNGFEEVLGRYKEIVPQLKLARADLSGGQYHVLVIIADGQVTRSVDTENGQLSPQEQKTVEAIVQASLSWGGDGPWDMMREFDDNIPSRAFDNFQVICQLHRDHVKNKAQSLKETEFLCSLMEIPQQYKATLELSLLGRRNGNIQERFPLPPPMHDGSSSYNNKPKANRVTSFKPSVPPYPTESYPVRSSPAPPATTSASDNQLCPICLSSPKDMAFGCGHQTCCECGPDLEVCPICRAPIQTRIKLY